jgi:two-component system NarL family sensor kinase
MQTGKTEIIIFLFVVTIIILLLVALIVTLLYLYQKKQLGYHEKLNALKLDYEKNLLSAQVEIQENTFQDISREIHDNINLSLTLAKLSLNTFDWKDLSKGNMQINSALEQITKAINDLSDISKSLNSELIIGQGLIKALEIEVEKIKEIHLFELDFKITGNPIFMESQKELIIFRIVQEGFNNIIKHAQATFVELKLHYNNEQLNVSLSDNGKGFCIEAIQQSVNKDSQAGLKNIRKRTAIFNGKALIDSIPGIGTTVFVTIPY